MRTCRSAGAELHEMPVNGNTNCWKSEDDRVVPGLPELRVRVAADVGRAAHRAGPRPLPGLRRQLRARQKAAGRLPRPLNNRLFDVDQWLDFNEVVQRDNRVLIGIALLFLGVCLVNVVGLLLAKFLNGAPLTGLRRALGASRRDIVRQHLTEVLLIGLAGGVLGLLLAIGWPRRHPRDLRSDNHDTYERLTRHRPDRRARDARAVAAGRASRPGCIPSWRIGRTAPAVYLKTQ